MKRRLNLSIAEGINTIQLSDLSSIDKNLRDRPSLYYVKNNYADDYYGKSVTLYRFAIVKETPYYYFLVDGQRINKKLRGRIYGLTPSDALGKAMERANNYMEILIRRGQQVHDFLQDVNGKQKERTRELRDFARIVERFKDADDVPSELLAAFDRNKELFEGQLK